MTDTSHSLIVDVYDGFQSASFIQGSGDRTLTINVNWINQPPHFAPTEYWVSIPEGCNLVRTFQCTSFYSLADFVTLLYPGNMIIIPSMIISVSQLKRSYDYTTFHMPTFEYLGRQNVRQPVILGIQYQS